MAPLIRTVTVDKSFPPVQNGKVVDEVDVARLRGDLELGRVCDALDGV